MYNLKKSINAVISIFFLLIIFNGCSSSGNKPNNPEPKNLSKNEQKMLGTWKLINTEGDDIYAGPPEGTYTWTFNADGSASYVQNPPNYDPSTINVDWRLDGDEIVFDNDTTYRVIKYGAKKMKWYNYKMAELGHSHIRVVEKQ